MERDAWTELTRVMSLPESRVSVLRVRIHTGRGGRLVVTAPLAPDLREFLARLPDVDAGLLSTL